MVCHRSESLQLSTIIAQSLHSESLHIASRQNVFNPMSGMIQSVVSLSRTSCLIYSWPCKLAVERRETCNLLYVYTWLTRWSDPDHHYINSGRLVGQVYSHANVLFRLLGHQGIVCPLNHSGCRRDCTYTYSTCIHTNTHPHTHELSPPPPPHNTHPSHRYNIPFFQPISAHKWWLSLARQNSTRISCEICRCNSASVQVMGPTLYQWLRQQVALLSQLLPSHLPMRASGPRKPSVQRSDELSPPG